MQRFIITCLLSAFICFNADAQVIEKGSWMMQGQGYFDRELKIPSSPFFNLSSQSEISYSAGLFLTSKLLTQLEVNLQTNTYRNNTGKSMNVFFRPTLRLSYYLNSDQPTPIKYFFTASIGLSAYFFSGINFSNSNPIGVKFDFGPGVDYLLNYNIVFSTQFIYRCDPLSNFGFSSTRNNLILVSSLKVLFNKAGRKTIQSEQFQTLAETGDFMIGGTGLSFNFGWGVASAFFVADDKISSFNFSITPRIGRFVSNRLVIGTGLTIRYFNQSYATTRRFVDVTGQLISMDEELETRQMILGFNPFARLYFNILNASKIRYFAEFNMDLLRSNLRSLQFGYQQSSTYTTTLNLMPGIDIMLSNRIALELALNGQLYSNSKVDGLSRKRTAIGLRLGFQYFLARA